MYTNPWADFKKGRLEYGETVEEIFVNLCRPYQFSPSKAEQDVFKRTIPDVRAAFHTMNFQKYYPITISDDQLRQAFLSWQGITDLIAAIVEMVYALSLIHISEPTRQAEISYAVFCLKKKKKKNNI